MKTAILLALFPAAMAAQFAEGTVYDALTGAPLPGVSVSAQIQNGPFTRTDASGHFRLQVASSYVVTAAKAGYLQSSQTVGRDLQNVRIDLKPESVITGKIVDEDGFPPGVAIIQPMRYQLINGRLRLVASRLAQSDERGEYRIDNLPAGRYYIHVSSTDAVNWDLRYVAQYRGGTLTPNDDYAVEVKTGETRKGINIQMKRFEGVTVSGRVEGATPNTRGMNVTLSVSSDQPDPGPIPMSQLDRDTNFTVRHVPPGTYTLRYGSYNPRAGELLAQVSVEVADHELSNLLLTAHTVQPVDIAGQVKAREGGPAGPWNVYLRPRTGTGASARSEEDGSFVVKGLLPEHYAVQVTPARLARDNARYPGRIVSITLGDVDVQEKGFDVDGIPQQKSLTVLVTDHYALLNATVVDTQGAPLAHTGIYLKGSQPDQAGSAVTNENGNVRVTLPEAGDYHVFVIDPNVPSVVGDDDYISAHMADFPMVRVALGANPPVKLVRNVPQ